MTINCSSTDKLILSIVDYIENILDDIPEDMKGESATPVAHHLFDIAEDATKLSRTNVDIFHHFVVQILYLSKRACLDIHLAVSLLCTRVREPDNDDYNKLARLMKYI